METETFSEIPDSSSAIASQPATQPVIAHGTVEEPPKAAKTTIEEQAMINHYHLSRVEVGPFFQKTLEELSNQGLVTDANIIKGVLERLIVNRCFICSGVGHRDTKCSQKARLIKLGGSIRRGFDKIISDGFKDLLNYENSTRTAITLQKPS